MFIQYPKPLAQTYTVGVTAPSSGVGPFTARFEYCKTMLSKRDVNIVEGTCLLNNERAVSASAAERAAELHQFWDDSDIDFIYPPWGGEQLIGILEHLDFQRIMNAEPKWLMGYSDISLLLFVLTTTTGYANVHGTNFMEYGPEEHETLTKNALDVLMCPAQETHTQHSALRYVEHWTSYKDAPKASLNVTEPVCWKTLTGDEAEFTGRLIGGCLDVLTCLAGSRFDVFPRFCQQLESDGIVLYLENCELNIHSQLRALMHLKYCGWFEGLSGVVLGRNTGPDSEDYPYTEMLKDFFLPLQLPLIFDTDIGHKQPNLSIVNGSIGTFTCQGDGSGSLRQSMA